MEHGFSHDIEYHKGSIFVLFGEAAVATGDLRDLQTAPAKVNLSTGDLNHESIGAPEVTSLVL